MMDLPFTVGGVTVSAEPHCSNCKHETAVDRHECNACARVWLATGMSKRPYWEPQGVNEE